MDAAPAKGPILAAVDFSESSEAALVWAADAAPRLDAELLVLHVVHDPSSAPDPDGAGDSEAPTYVRRLEEVAEARFAEFMDAARAARPDLRALTEARTHLVVGLPATRIVEVAEREDARMIVVGSQGRTGLSRILLGSKAERVAQLAPVPVTIVKAG